MILTTPEEIYLDDRTCEEALLLQRRLRTAYSGSSPVASSVDVHDPLPSTTTLMECNLVAPRIGDTRANGGP